MPVIVTDEVPDVAFTFAVSVSKLVPVDGFVPNDADTPAGKPEAVNATLPLKLLVGVIVIVLVPLVPL